MDSWKLFKIELDKDGIQITDAMVQQLTPMYLRWQEYVRQTRKIALDQETEPFAEIEPKQ